MASASPLLLYLYLSIKLSLYFISILFFSSNSLLFIIFCSIYLLCNYLLYIYFLLIFSTSSLFTSSSIIASSNFFLSCCILLDSTSFSFSTLSLSSFILETAPINSALNIYCIPYILFLSNSTFGIILSISSSELSLSYYPLM
jgi:hypothetical protein